MIVDARVEADVRGVMDMLDRVIDRSADWSSSWESVGREFWAARERRIFETGNFGRWAPLKFRTLKAKKREGASDLTLVRTGTIFRQITTPTPKASSGRFAVYGPIAPAPYAKFHVKGRGVPQRNPVPKLSVAERVSIIRILRRQFFADIAKGGSGSSAPGRNPMAGR